MSGQSIAARLRTDLERIGDLLSNLVEGSPVHYFDRGRGAYVVVGHPDYVFDATCDAQQRLQLSLRQTYGTWFERFSLLYPDPTDEIARKLKRTDEAVRNWIELGRNHKLGADQKKNALTARESLGPFYQLLKLLEVSTERVIVPDTNAMIAVPDASRYGNIAGSKIYTFILLPTVLGELDNLKNQHRDHSFRDKISKVIRRIKGWRRQGALLEGVVIHKTVTVRLLAREPQMDRSLTWLDNSNRDDRIIASVLEIENCQPNANVVLVTSDINLQNKAEAARLAYAEPPTK